MMFSPRRLVLAGCFGLSMMSPALAAGVTDAPTALDGTTILPDPSLKNGRVLPASAATAGVAAVSASEDGPLQNCSRRNPCAAPTPARDHVSIGVETAGKHGDDVPDAKPHAPAGGSDLRS